MLVGEILNMVIAQTAEPVPDAERCTTKFIDGTQSPSEETSSLPNPFVIRDHLPRQTEGLDPDAPADTIPPKPLAPWLPDLALGAVGQPKMINQHKVDATPAHCCSPCGRSL
jgi:hypothetical protein